MWYFSPLTLCFAGYLTTVYEFYKLFTTEMAYGKSDGLKEEPKTNVFSHHTARETEENYE
jgi:hypothetical protein